MPKPIKNIIALIALSLMAFSSAIFLGAYTTYLPMLFSGHSNFMHTPDPCFNSPYPPPPGRVCPTYTPTRDAYPAPGTYVPPTDWPIGTLTPTPIPTATRTSSVRKKLFVPHVYNNQSATSTPTPSSENIAIIDLKYKGSGFTEPDEYVELQNQGTQSIHLAGWTLRDASNHVYTFPVFTLYPSQICRVYTDFDDPNTCGFNFKSSQAIWNNSGDIAILMDEQSNLIDIYHYP